MKQYLDLLRDILDNGNTRGDRTGTGTRSVFGRQMRFDLTEGFPMVTTKKLHLRAIIHELLWFIAGDTNNETLRANKVSIWDEWALDEDITDEVVLHNHERAALYAEQTGRSVAQVTAELNQMGVEAGILHLNNCGIPRTRTEIVIPKGSLGPVYGRQWRSWRGPRGEVIDQLAQVIHDLKSNPWSRRHIVTAWNPVDLPDESISPIENVKRGKMALAACHCLFQFYVTPMTLLERCKLGNDLLQERGQLSPEHDQMNGFWNIYPEDEIPTVTQRLDEMGIPDKKLSCQLYQRSADTFLGVPFNIASYALLTHMVAQVCDMAVGEFVWTGGDVHIYANHFAQVEEQLKRDPLLLPRLKLNPAIKNIDDFRFEDIEVVDYVSHAKITAPISV